MGKERNFVRLLNRQREIDIADEVAQSDRAPLLTIGNHLKVVSGSAFVTTLVAIDLAMQTSQIQDRTPLRTYDTHLSAHGLKYATVSRPINQPEHWSRCKESRCQCPDKLRRIVGLKVVLSRTPTALGTLLCEVLKFQTSHERNECRRAARIVHQKAELAMVEGHSEINFYRLLSDHYQNEGIEELVDYFAAPIKKTNIRIAQEARRWIEKAKRIARTRETDTECVYR
jgi:hypothetical protein